MKPMGGFLTQRELKKKCYEMKDFFTYCATHYPNLFNENDLVKFREKTKDRLEVSLDEYSIK